MRVLVAGANGALGVPLTRLLVARGHSVGRAGQAYNVVDDQPATWEELFTAMASDLCRDDPILPRLPADRLRAGM
jgi:dTDP-4-dehydrorhamnose reductase